MRPQGNPLTLLGEEISGAWNTDALADIAHAFGGEYLPLTGAEQEATSGTLDRFDWLVAAENRPDAESAYTYRPPRHGRGALLVGNEAKGLRRSTLKRANAVLEIPVPSRNINCLNVAAAAAVLLYYFGLPLPLPQKKRTLSAVQKSRPDLLLLGGLDPMELGSVVRSACAFGWDRLFLNDRSNIWYECDRRIKSEGRGAARRGRNPIRVVPYAPSVLADYRRILVFGTHYGGRAPHLLPLLNADTLLVLNDETNVSALPDFPVNAEILFAALPSVQPQHYHYRQMASIAIAEASRQLGWPDSDGIYLQSRRSLYRKEIQEQQAPQGYEWEDLCLF